MLSIAKDKQLQALQNNFKEFSRKMTASVQLYLDLPYKRFIKFYHSIFFHTYYFQYFTKCAVET